MPCSLAARWRVDASVTIIVLLVTRGWLEPNASCTWTVQEQQLQVVMSAVYVCTIQYSTRDADGECECRNEHVDLAY